LDDPRQLRLTELFYAHADAVHRYATQRIGGHDAADVVSDTFLVAWRKLEKIQPGSERAWLFNVARREMLTRARRGARRGALYARLLADGIAAAADGNAARSGSAARSATIGVCRHRD
jgi:RNA polymerase sigma-70 factor (ECF subfamily)